MDHQRCDASGILSTKMLKFVAAWAGDAIAAARAAGYRHPESVASKIMQNQTVSAEIRRKQRIMTEESAKGLASQLNFNRSHVLNRLWEIAQLTPSQTSNSVSGQVKAAETLAALFDAELKHIAELLPQLQTRTPDEIQFWIRHGHFPLSSGENHEKKSETTEK